RSAAGADRLRGGAGAEQCGHWILALYPVLRRDKKQGHPVRPGAGVDPEFEPVGFAEWKGAVISQEIDVEIVLADRRDLQSLVAPRQIDFAKIHRAGRWD